MKDFLLSILTFPGLVILIYFLGIVSNKIRHKVKFFSIGLMIMFLLSLPIFSIILSYPLISLPKHMSQLKNNDLSNIKSIVILTGGIYKNIMNRWQPSRSTEERVYLAKNILTYHNIPVLISGGFSKSGAPSEAQLTKSFYNLNNAIIETESQNTYQSSINLKNYCEKINGPILIITDKYHSLRSYLSFKSQGCITKVFDHNFNIKLKDIIPSILGYTYFNKMVYEYLGLLYYILTFKINFLNIFSV